MQITPLTTPDPLAIPWIPVALEKGASYGKRVATTLAEAPRPAGPPMCGSAVTEAILDFFIQMSLEDDILDPPSCYQPPTLKDLTAVFRSAKGKPLDLVSVTMLLAFRGRMAPLPVLKQLLAGALGEGGCLEKTEGGCFILKSGNRHARRRAM